MTFVRFVLKSCDNRAVGRHGIRQPGAPLPSRGRASAGATTGSPRHQGDRGTRDDVTMGRQRCVPEGSRRLSLSPATRFSQNDNRARRNATDALCSMPYLILVGTRSGSEPTPPRSRPLRVKLRCAPCSPPIGGGSGWCRRHDISAPGPEWAVEAVMLLRAPSMLGGDVSCCATLGGHTYAQSPCSDGPDAR